MGWTQDSNNSPKNTQLHTKQTVQVRLGGTEGQAETSEENQGLWTSRSPEFLVVGRGTRTQWLQSWVTACSHGQYQKHWKIQWGDELTHPLIAFSGQLMWDSIVLSIGIQRSRWGSHLWDVTVVDCLWQSLGVYESEQARENMNLRLTLRLSAPSLMLTEI